MLQEEKLIEAFEFFGYTLNTMEQVLLVERLFLIARKYNFSEKEIVRHYFQFSRAEQLVTLEKVDEFEDHLLEKFPTNIEQNNIADSNIVSSISLLSIIFCQLLLHI